MELDVLLRTGAGKERKKGEEKFFERKTDWEYRIQPHPSGK